MSDKNTNKQTDNNKKHHYDNGAFIYVRFFLLTEKYLDYSVYFLNFDKSQL